MSDNPVAVCSPGEERFKLAQREARSLALSELVPQNYRGDSPKAVANCMIAMELANRLGTSPMMVMQNLYIISGKPSWASSFIIAAINSCGRFSTLQFDKQGEGENMTCRAFATDRESGARLEGPMISMKMAREEGWLTKPGSKWKTMPELMIQYRAAAFFGRLYAPELLAGLHTADEVQDFKQTSQPSAVQETLDRLATVTGEVITAEAEVVQEEGETERRLSGALDFDPNDDVPEDL